MKRRWQFLLVLILVLSLLNGCIVQTVYLELNQEIENISLVEIHRFDYDTQSTTPIITLELDEGKALVSDLAALPMKRVLIGDPMYDPGYIVVYVTYQNSEAVMIGDGATIEVDVNGEWDYDFDSYNPSEWSAVVIKYVDLELVPELAQFLES